MAKATAEQTRKANRAAAVVAVVVAAFAACFIGLVLLLDGVAAEQQQEEVVIAEQAPTEPFYVLLIGSDTRKGTALYTGRPTEHAQVDQRSDVMTLMRVDPQAYTVSLLTVPRDTVVTAQSEKLNSALLGDDPNQVVEAVGEVTGLTADYYMLTTFGMFADLVDALGGVTVDVVQDVEVSDATTGGTIIVRAGENQLLNGAQALALARARTEYQVEQDAVRQSNVRLIEQAIIERMLGGDSIGIEALLVVLEHDVQTDMDLAVVGLSVLDFMDHADEVTIYSGTGPFSGDIRAEDGQWVIQNDEEAWKKIIKRFKKGKDFTTVVEQPTYAPPEPDPAKGVIDPYETSAKNAGTSKSAESKSIGTPAAKEASGSSSAASAKTAEKQ